MNIRELKNTTSKRIKEIRGHLNLSQLAFAEKIDVSLNTINRIERGKALPDLRTVVTIAEKCHVSIEYVLGLSPFVNEEEYDKALSEAQLEIDRLTVINKEFFTIIEQAKRVLDGKAKYIQIENPRRSK